MKSSFARYRSVGHKLVTGFMEPEVLLVAGALDEAQRARSVGGACVSPDSLVAHSGEYATIPSTCRLRACAAATTRSGVDQS